jgi:hypothetical protein
MSSRLVPFRRRFVLPPAALLVAATVLAGCVGSGGQPTGSSSPSSSPSGSSTPSGSTSPNGFYLRTWQTQALPTPYTFGWLPSATIADGQYINGVVAVPMIYPGPIYIGLPARPISTAGIDAIVAEARKDGLLDAKTDFTGEPMPGSILTHIRLTVDGVTHDLTGPLPTAVSSGPATPGTTAAYLALLSLVTSIESWLAADLGPSTPYQPDRIAVLLTPPTDANGGIAAKEDMWPLASPFETFGKAYGAGNRCATVTGPDLKLLLPVIQASNQLTLFFDSVDARMTMQAMVLVPGDDGPCPQG